MRSYDIGMIETLGYIPAVEALDSVMKCSSVEFSSIVKVGSGIVTVVFYGNIEDVKIAMGAGVSAARKVGEVLSYKMISGFDIETFNVLFLSSTHEEEKQEDKTLNMENSYSNTVLINDVDSDINKDEFGVYTLSDIEVDSSIENIDTVENVDVTYVEHEFSKKSRKKKSKKEV